MGILDARAVVLLNQPNKKFQPHGLDDYTRQEIPADHKQMPTSEIVSRIEHLKEIDGEIPAYDPEMEIVLVTGSNCPKALAALMVIPNDGDDPFALQLSHLWTVSSPVYVTTEPETRKLTAHRSTVREVERVKESSLLSPC